MPAQACANLTLAQAIQAAEKLSIMTAIVELDREETIAFSPMTTLSGFHGQMFRGQMFRSQMFRSLILRPSPRPA
jgi:hypothetical protein